MRICLSADRYFRDSKNLQDCAKDSAVLIYTPPLADRPIRFNGPETVADVPVEGHEMYYQAVLGCRDFQLAFLGWTDTTFR
jgi:hypothetical protein